MIARYIITFGILCFSMSLSFGQSITGFLEQHFDTIIDNMPGNSGNDFQAPAQSEITPWTNTISALLDDDVASARISAYSIGYEVIEYFDLNSNRLYYVLKEKPPQSRYWGTYVFNPLACRNQLVIQSPHPKYDTNTGYEGIFCFTRLNARAFFLSGTHRCNQSTNSGCSGSTSACGVSGPFRISDNPHNDKSAFQLATEVIHNSFPATVFVQLHGFAKQSTDPYVIISNGTRVTPAQDHALTFSNNLFQEDTSLTFKIAHIDTTWTRLIAFTNVQGRYVNQSSDACGVSATNSDGLFIHVEQEKTKLRDDSVGWYKVYAALANTFSCDPVVALLEVEKIDDDVVAYPSPSGDFLMVKGSSIKRIQLFDQFGRLLYSESVNMNFVELDLSSIASGIYWIRVDSSTGVILKKIVKI